MITSLISWHWAKWWIYSRIRIGRDIKTESLASTHIIKQITCIVNRTTKRRAWIMRNKSQTARTQTWDTHKEEKVNDWECWKSILTKSVVV